MWTYVKLTCQCLIIDVWFCFWSIWLFWVWNRSFEWAPMAENTLLHSSQGWRPSPAWREARQCPFGIWRMTFEWSTYHHVFLKDDIWYWMVTGELRRSQSSRNLHDDHHSMGTNRHAPRSQLWCVGSGFSAIFELDNYLLLFYDVWYFWFVKRYALDFFEWVYD